MRDQEGPAMAKQHCRDCSKCTERGVTSTVKALANATLIVCTLGISAVVSKMIHSGRKLCPQCGHPLSRHERVASGMFKD
jgi:hypothetical protein